VARRRRARDWTPAADGAVAALSAIGTQALVDNPSTWPAVYVLAGAFAGALVGREPSVRAARPAVARGCSVALLVLGFAVADAGPYLAWRAAENAQLERAARLNPLHPDYKLRIAEDLLTREPGWDVEAYARARESAEEALRLHPLSVRYQRGAAHVEAHACRTLFRDEACRQRVVERYRRAAELARHDPFLPAALAAFLLDTGDPAGARRAAEQALALEPEAVVPRLLLADASIEEGRAGGLVRARELLADARARAARWSSWDENEYGRRLLSPDPAILARLEAKLVAAEHREALR
jgi:hypothetical protein